MGRDKDRTSLAGLNTEEQKVMDFLVGAYNTFSRLTIQHPSDQLEFAQAIHVLQGILGMRVLRRDYPEGWAIYSE